ncbi:hypothetical protein CYLTODRAFT_417097 [Cylindrobasidium torrendii FP15055 ss-10]|uniref:Uncharacterized protein n=1 Tax=Cylindrobasidium torrendii FP15055 ss-10 TaxID=1314674 RepID=A0A0D7BTC4_9AGAR|nr:hypothetical protein CYLTODRAFT_417097 [Cylindrobasidium torrendii FP15055 ss-10]
MGDDVANDAPEISTLREDLSPPPPPVSAPSLASKLRVLQPSPRSQGPSPPLSAGMKRTQSDQDADADDDDQEDQLIDDDPPPSHGSSPAKQSQAGTPKRKTPAKRKAAKMDAGGSVAGDPPPSIGSNDSAGVPPPAKKKRTATPSKTKSAPGTPAPRTGKRGAKAKTAISHLIEDSGATSEGVTAPSSPITMAGTPEPERPPPAQSVVHPTADEIDLKTVAIPVYALPTKPFLVQAVPKIPLNGPTFTPVPALDRKNKKPVRKWHVAKREIRGIAGGRWFARTWVGDKNSEYVGGKNAMAEAALAIPRPPGTVMARSAKGRAGKSNVGTAGPSRAQSVAAEPIPPPRNLTKMRTSYQNPPADTPAASDGDF